MKRIFKLAEQIREYVNLADIRQRHFKDDLNGWIRLCAAIAVALYVPATSALMADYVPRNMRGRIMSAVGRGSTMIGSTGGGAGGPGRGGRRCHRPCPSRPGSQWLAASPVLVLN